MRLRKKKEIKYEKRNLKKKIWPRKKKRKKMYEAKGVNPGISKTCLDAKKKKSASLKSERGARRVAEISTKRRRFWLFTDKQKSRRFSLPTLRQISFSVFPSYGELTLPSRRLEMPLATVSRWSPPLSTTISRWSSPLPSNLSFILQRFLHYWRWPFLPSIDPQPRRNAAHHC